MIKIKMFKAEEGDAFLLSFGKNKDINILIDCGTDETYFAQIKPELQRLNEEGKQIDLLVVTHIDNDHILGAVELLKENEANGKIITIKEVWHNSYRHLQFDKCKENDLPKEQEAIIKEIVAQNKPVPKKNGLQNIGYKEGTSLAGLLYKYEYNWNKSFNNNAVCVENLPVVTSIPNLKITLLSPNSNSLEKLAKKWQKKLNSIFYGLKLTDNELFDDAFEFYMQNLRSEESEIKNTSIKEIKDDVLNLANKEEREYSVTNGSSISFIIEYNTDKILFLADAHEKGIFEMLNGLKEKGYDCSFKVVKLSHHGSNKNISNRLLKIIETPNYLVSTDGNKYNHPDIEVIAKIIMKETRGEKNIVFNYEHDKLSIFNDKKLREKYGDFEMIVSNEITI